MDRVAVGYLTVATPHLCSAAARQHCLVGGPTAAVLFEQIVDRPAKKVLHGNIQSRRQAPQLTSNRNIHMSGHLHTPLAGWRPARTFADLGIPNDSFRSETALN